MDRSRISDFLNPVFLYTCTTSSELPYYITYISSAVMSFEIERPDLVIYLVFSVIRLLKVNCFCKHVKITFAFIIFNWKICTCNNIFCLNFKRYLIYIYKVKATKIAGCTKLRMCTVFVLSTYTAWVLSYDRFFKNLDLRQYLPFMFYSHITVWTTGRLLKYEKSLCISISFLYKIIARSYNIKIWLLQETDGSPQQERERERGTKEKENEM